MDVHLSTGHVVTVPSEVFANVNKMKLLGTGSFLVWLFICGPANFGGLYTDSPIKVFVRHFSTSLLPPPFYIFSL